MSFPSAHVWRRISRPIELLDEARASLGTVQGNLRGVGERELEGGAAISAAVLVVLQRDLDALGIDRLHRFMHARDPVDQALYSVTAVRLATMHGGRIVKAELEGVGV